jgi:hypothetical protein
MKTTNRLCQKKPIITKRKIKPGFELLSKKVFFGFGG